MSLALICDGCRTAIPCPSGSEIKDVRPNDWLPRFFAGKCVYDLCPLCLESSAVQREVNRRLLEPAKRRKRVASIIDDLIGAGNETLAAQVKIALADIERPPVTSDPDLLADGTLPQDASAASKTDDLPTSDPETAPAEQSRAMPTWEAIRARTIASHPMPSDGPKTGDLKRCSLIHVTPQEAARRLGLSVWTIRRMVDRGQLAGVVNQTGSRRRYMIPITALKLAESQGLGKRNGGGSAD